MKRLFLRSLIIAIILGPLCAFVISAITYHHARKYDPPFTQDEEKRMDNMTVKEFHTLLSTREVKFIPYAQWVAESIGTSHFWKFLGKFSLVPSASIFLACICMGILERRKAREVVAPPKNVTETHGNPLA
jgi:hypothetical protein